MSGYSIQPGKVQPPPLRDETLARHRLLDWLEVKIHNRVVFVIADAGYGKTTLLADFSRRTRLRTLWYRMDREDRNWVAFLSCLVAAGRVHDPGFAPRTAALLKDTGPGGATRDDALEAFLKELPSIAADGATIILDDFHVADDVADVTHIARELVARAPERLTLVVSSRRTPSLPVARLRALGEVAELRTTDLRFSTEETDALFKETYGRALEPDVLADLSRRTDGWAASLHLVWTALRDRSAAETRTFVRSLTGAQSELYDYLAEEVVGDLPQEHQAFLMRTSILQLVEPEAAQVATDLPPERVSALIAESERLGLLSRRQGGTRTGHRYHPLVRGFLESRLRRDAGDEGIRQIHVAVGSWAEQRDWQTACHHFAAAADPIGVGRVIDASIERIAGSGGFRLAADFLEALPVDPPRASFEIIRSRVDYQNGDFDAAVARADLALRLAPESDAALNNCAAIHGNRGDHAVAWELARQLADTATSPIYRSIAAASCAQYESSVDGSVQEAIRLVSQLIRETEAGGHVHYVGISYLNSANSYRAAGNWAASLAASTNAIDYLRQSDAAAELVAAHLVRAWALAHSGNLAGARDDVSAAAQLVPRSHRGEWLVESADIETTYGSADRAYALVEEAKLLDLPPPVTDLRTLVESLLRLREGSVQDARKLADGVELRLPCDEPARKCRHIAVRAQIAIAQGRPDAHNLVRSLREQAVKQSAIYWERVADVLGAAITGGRTFDALVTRLDELAYLSATADVVVARLDGLGSANLDRVRAEAVRFPDRWLLSLRREIQTNGASRWEAAEILDVIGTAEDVVLLRSVARSSRGRLGRTHLGKSLARRLAPRVMVEDQGRVEIQIGTSRLPRSAVRRKVLALLCLLLTRPRFSATRDEVIDALWPDMSPDVAGNSLNQTVYFLRRVFEPEYKEDLSAGYVQHSSDVLWLDPELIAARSARCLAAIDAIRRDPSPGNVDSLSALYLDRFALDFSYEEWAVPFRNALHTAYLEVIEAAVTADMASGHYERAIRLARQALVVDPTVDSLELSLLRLYRGTGAHAAAAELYTHYSSVLRDELGVEPPPLASL